MIEMNTEYSNDPHAFQTPDRLDFSFPEVHADARFSLEFQRTLRIPDDDQVHRLPPGLGRFPLRHVDDFADRVPAGWSERGGVMLPMFQSEAMWVRFQRATGYPFLIKIAAGKINAVTGEPWSDTPNRDPQDYLVVPGQPWLDGFCVKKGEIRQFVAAPLGTGYSVEEQVTGRAEHGGVQIVAYPMKAEEWEKVKAERREMRFGEFACGCGSLSALVMDPSMGLAQGGRMRQTIEEDPHDFSVWDLRHRSRCFVHIANSLAWRAITGEAPPTLPPTAKDYTDAGLPWFEYYSDGKALEGSKILAGVKSVAALDAGKGPGQGLLPENEPVGPVTTVKLGAGAPGVVREF